MGAVLRARALVRGGAHARVEKEELLLDRRTVAGEQQHALVAVGEGRFPVDDLRCDVQAAAGVAQQLQLLLEAPGIPALRNGRAVVSLVDGRRGAVHFRERPALAGFGPVAGRGDGFAKTPIGQVAGRRIPAHAVHGDGHHSAGAAQLPWRLGYVLAHTESFLVGVDQAERPVIDAVNQVQKPFGNVL